MKKIFLIKIILLSFSYSFGQVIIGTGKASPTNSSVSLEFGTEKKGLVLPWVDSAVAVTGAVDGTLIYDTADKKVKVLENGIWTDQTLLVNGIVDTSLQDSLTEQSNAKVSVGTPTSTPGILVLEDTNKGMILPLINSYTEITSPTTGMMVFDTTKKLLCFFNGKQWTFWQP